MRRGGLGGVYKNKKMNDDIKKFGQKIEAKNLDEMKKQLEQFSNNLSEFGAKYKNEIKINPEFRKDFYQMCTELGVDPLASKSLWDKTLNLSEFYYELAIQIITISLALRDKLGALIELEDLKNYLVKQRKKDDINEIDIQKAIESVSELKCGFQMVNLSKDKNGKKAVMTIPFNISSETNELIQLANENNGLLSYSIYKNKTGQSEFRFDSVVHGLIENGIVWIDEIENRIEQMDKYFTDKNDKTLYWFPGIVKLDKLKQ